MASAIRQPSRRSALAALAFVVFALKMPETADGR
jgi:hypothetical protein